MNTTMLTRPRVHNVFNGNRKDMRGLEFPDATLCECKETRDGQVDIADVALKGVSFRSPRPLSPGRVQYLNAKGANSSSLSSALRIVSCKLRGDGEFDVSAEFF